jgi:histidine triad (HIT) family protein
MSVDCLFCKVVSGEIKTHTVFEDDTSLAFLDVNPQTKGHTLVIPKIHVSRLEHLDRNNAEALFYTLYRMNTSIQKAVDAPFTTIVINNGIENGQKTTHVHAHIIPRFKGYKGRSIHSVVKSRRRISQDEMKKIATEIRKRT